MTHRFLIADHDARVREECRRFLAARGHEVEVAANGLECIEQARAACPEILVLDPDILWGGGAGVLEWIVAEEPLAGLTVVLAEGDGRPLPERVRGLITARLARPNGLREVLAFVERLQAIADRESRPESGLDVINPEMRVGNDR